MQKKDSEKKKLDLDLCLEEIAKKLRPEAKGGCGTSHSPTLQTWPCSCCSEGAAETEFTFSNIWECGCV